MNRLHMKYITTLILIATMALPPIVFADDDVPVDSVSDAAAAPIVSEVQTVAAPIDVPVIDEVPPTVVLTEEPAIDAPLPEFPSEPVVLGDAVTETPADSTDPTIVQDTAPTQESAPLDVLEATVDPVSATTTESEVILVLEASSTPAEIPVAVVASTTEVVIEEAPAVDVETPVEIPEEILLPPSEELNIVAKTLTSDVETIVEDIVLIEEEDPKYVIELSGKTIPTKKKGIIGTSALATPTATSIDSTTGNVTVSGSCARPYFVVLIFKNEDDYETDPRSFIMNKAFQCADGAYSYSIDRLPATLPNGTYYLMVGEQGESGPWTPATGLTEITINRSN